MQKAAESLLYGYCVANLICYFSKIGQVKTMHNKPRLLLLPHSLNNTCKNQIVVLLHKQPLHFNSLGSNQSLIPTATT